MFLPTRKKDKFAQDYFKDRAKRILTICCKYIEKFLIKYIQ